MIAGKLQGWPLEEETRRFPSVGCSHSKMDPPLAKAELISNVGDNSVVTCFRKGKKHHIAAVREKKGKKRKE